MPRQRHDLGTGVAGREPDKGLRVGDGGEFAGEHRPLLRVLSGDDMDREPCCFRSSGQPCERVISGEDDEFVVSTGDPVQVDGRKKCFVGTIRCVCAEDPLDIVGSDDVAVLARDATGCPYDDVVVRRDTRGLLGKDFPQLREFLTRRLGAMGRILDVDKEVAALGS